MKRKTADLLVAGVAFAILLFGGIWSYQANQRPTTMNGSMMDSMMDGSTTTYGTDPIVYVLGALLIAAIVAGGYLAVRDDLTTTQGAPAASPSTNRTSPDTNTGPNGTSEAETDEPPVETGAKATPDESSGQEVAETPQSETAPDANPERAATTELLQYLPTDERRVLEPVIDAPGLTQIEIRDRSDFSKSKVSQTLSELEQRGLIYKEKQGRTFRVYPGEELTEEN